MPTRILSTWDCRCAAGVRPSSRRCAWCGSGRSSSFPKKCAESSATHSARTRERRLVGKRALGDGGMGHRNRSRRPLPPRTRRQRMAHRRQLRRAARAGATHRRGDASGGGNTMNLRLRPVLDFQPRHTGKFRRVVRHQRRIVCKRGGSNPKIIRADARACLFPTTPGFVRTLPPLPP